MQNGLVQLTNSWPKTLAIKQKFIHGATSSGVARPGQARALPRHHAAYSAQPSVLPKMLSM